MISPKNFFDYLQTESINFFSGVPDSLLQSICAYISDHSPKDNHIISANEGGAISLGIGYHISTNRIPLIYMQNSGLGNAVNPLLSLADKDVYSIPMILMIGWRGEPGVKDEPQHHKQGRVTISMLESMEIPYIILSPETSNLEAYKIIKKAVQSAKQNCSPFALLVKKGTFEKYNLKKYINDNIGINREQALKIIVDELSQKDIIVATTGVTSRELFEYRNNLKHAHEKDFLTVGGMGHANQIALGIALQKPKINVYCFDGDGAILMHMGALAINANVDCNNLKHIVFNNGAHDSVGGQPTVAKFISLSDIAKASGYKTTLIASTEDEIKHSISVLSNFHGPCFLEIIIDKGFREDLGRPTKSPLQNKKDLMNYVTQL